MSGTKPVVGWVIGEVSKGNWALRYTGDSGLIISGFESSQDAGNWLLAFFRQNADREAEMAYRERRTAALDKMQWEASCAEILGARERGKKH